MTHTLFVKNMVCNRCKMTIIRLLNDEGYEVESIQLGKIVVKEQSSNDYSWLEEQLNDLGFEVIKDPAIALVEKIKINLIQHIEKNDTDEILGNLESEIGKSYSTLSKTFSKSEGITLEKYLINLKLEKAKELIQLNQLNFSEIARIWSNGCIIKSDLMNVLHDCFKQQADLMDMPQMTDILIKNENALPKVLTYGLEQRVSLHCFSSAYYYWVDMTTNKLPANLIQAQRDFFGAHTYQRIDDDTGAHHHTNWKTV